MIDINMTLWFQVVNFFITLIALNYLLIAPIRKIIRERKQKMDSFSGAIESFTAEGQKLLDGYEAELAQARADASQYRKEAKAEAEVEQRAIVAAAEKDAQISLQTARATARTDTEKAHSELQAELKLFTDAAVAKILG